MEQSDSPLLPKCVASTAAEEPAASGSPSQADSKEEVENREENESEFSNYFKEVEWYGFPTYYHL